MQKDFQYKYKANIYHEILNYHQYLMVYKYFQLNYKDLQVLNLSFFLNSKIINLFVIINNLYKINSNYKILIKKKYKFTYIKYKIIKNIIFHNKFSFCLLKY